VSRHNDRSRSLAALIGAAALVFSLLYFLSDLIELRQGGFSTPQLVVTYAAEAPIPLFVLGLYAVQRPQIGTVGLIAAITYAYAFVFFTGTVLYALADRTPNWDALQNRLGAWLTLHSALMVLAGIGFGVSTIRASPLPTWTGGDPGRGHDSDDRSSSPARCRTDRRGLCSRPGLRWDGRLPAAAVPARPGRHGAHPGVHVPSVRTGGSRRTGSRP
jgi:hypothetical protein